MSRARTFADLATASEESSLANRNLLINGDMSVAQRGTSLSVVHDGTVSGHSCDRWELQLSTSGNALDQLEGTLAQVAVTDLAGFNNALKWTTTEPESAIDANETFDICQKIEAQHCQRLGFGLSSAKSSTLSFYVKSSVTGTYGINVYKADSTARQLTSTYTINSADTWEKKTITIPGDTDSSGTIADDTGEGLRISWHLGTGSDSTSSNTALTWTNFADAGWAYGHAQNGVATTDNATWFLTGVQWEVGTVATPFEQQSYGDNLARCQRYYFQVGKYPSSSGYGILGTFAAADTSSGFTLVDFPVYMRTEPTFSHSGTASDYSLYITNSHKAGSGGFSASSGDILKHMYVYTEHSGGITAGDAGHLTTNNNNTDAFLGFSAEL